MKPALRVLTLLLIAAILFSPGALPAAGQAETPGAPHKSYLPLIKRQSLVPPRRLGPDVAPAGTGIVVSPLNSSVVYAGIYGGGVFKSTNAGASWAPASQGLPDSAYVLSLVMDPANASRLYAGLYYNGEPDYASGVYRSEDAGQTWVPTGRMDNPDAGVYSNLVVVYDLALSSDGSVIYAATRSKVPTPPYPYGCGGIFKSTNHGQTWSLVNNGLPENDLYVYDIAFDLTDDNWVYAGLHGSGVYRTTNGAASWLEMNQGIASAVVDATAKRSIVVDLAAENRLLFGTLDRAAYASFNYATTWAAQIFANVYMFVPDPNRAHAVYATDGSGTVYYSANFGTTWDKRAARATDGFLSIDPGQEGVLFAGGPNGTTALKKSTDAGETFFAVNNGLSGYAVTSLAAEPVNAGRLFISLPGWGVMSSTDGGGTWAQTNNGLPTLAIRGLAADPRQPGLLYALTPAEGVYRSTDGGANWSALNAGYPAAGELDAASLPYGEAPALETLYSEAAAEMEPELNAAALAPALSAAVSPASPGTLLVGTLGKGVIRWDGSAWAATNVNAGTVYTLLFDAAAPGRAWLGGDPAAGTLQVSTDGGATWASAAAGLGGRTVLWLSQGAQSLGLLLAGTEAGVYTSLDGGASWAPGGLAGQAVRATAVHPLDSRLLAATSNGLYISADDGVHWDAVNTGQSGCGYLGIRPAPDAPGFFYVYSRYCGVLLVNE